MGDGHSRTLVHCSNTKEVCSLQPTILVSGWRQKPIPTSKIKMSPSSFGVPRAIVTDNGPQFDGIVFRTFYSKLNNKNLYSKPHYPQSNGKIEATNKILLNALKKRLEGANKKWVDELLGVLWAYRTTSRRPTGTTPFAVAYGMETNIPTEIGICPLPKQPCKTKGIMMKNS